VTITAKIIADSSNGREGNRLTTFEVRYPRFIHGEVMTHRVFSRNASSSRAIPVKKLIADIRRDPAMPVHWGKNQPGMQANQELQGWQRKAVKGLWLSGMWVMTTVAQVMTRIGAHKQIVNRMIEPWSHITVVITATDYQNFFTLRCHKDAQPEIKVLAEKMRELYWISIPKELKRGEWHLPYVTEADEKRLNLDDQIKVSIARCARTSHKTHDGRPSELEEDIKLYDRLLGSQPLHASPAEHQATPDFSITTYNATLVGWENENLRGNLTGFIQYRKTLDNEYVRG
jgi:hypothetical protein